MIHVDYDAIVVGSGASGGVAARRLCENGQRVLLVERGRAARFPEDFDDRNQAVRGEKSPAPRHPTQSKHWLFDDESRHLFIDDEEHPYEAPSPFHWYRSQVLGGRTLLWGRTCFRMSNHEFKKFSLTGRGEDWPLAYEDLSPYYSLVEGWAGIQASRDAHPGVPDGGVGPVPAMDPLGDWVGARIKRRWSEQDFIYARKAKGEAKRAEPGSLTNFPVHTSLGFGVAPAIATGRLTIETDAAVSKLILGESNRVEGVEVLCKNTKAVKFIRAKSVVLCASPIETIRILLNSDLPAEEGNFVGSHFMDHTMALSVADFSPGVALEPGYQKYFCVPALSKSLLQSRGFSTMIDIRALNEPRAPYEYCAIHFGEVEARETNRISLEKNRMDTFRMPVPKITLRYGEEDLAIFQRAVDFSKLLAEELGAQIVFNNFSGAIPGESIHELGGARMGTSPANSFVNSFGQSWARKNLFILDGSSFVSSGTQNPTLTIMALAARGADYLSQLAWEEVI